MNSNGHDLEVGPVAARRRRTRGTPTALRGAIVGFGLIAERAHVEALRQVGLEISAVVDVLPERRLAASRILPGVRLYDDVEAMLACERPRGLDFVNVCTPPHLHVAVAEAAARAGVHALVEKPLATTLADAVRLAALAARHHTVIACVNNWTQAPILLRAQELASSGALGALREVEIVVERTQPAATAESDNWRTDRTRSGGGILFDHGWHGMSILGRAIPHVAQVVRGVMHRRRHRNLGVEDTAAVEIDFDGGARARFTATWAADVRRNRMRVRGTDGSLEVDNDVLRIVRGGEGGEERFAESLADGGYRAGWTAAIVREFVDEIVHPERPRRSVDEALTCMKLLVAAYESHARGGQSVALGAASQASDAAME